MNDINANKASAFSCSSCGDLSKANVPLNWPIKITMAPIEAECYNNADMLIAGDCTGFSYPRLNVEYVNGHVVLICCPKENSTACMERLAEILEKNDIRSLTVARVDTPCCEGLEKLVKDAIKASGRVIPCQTIAL